MDNKSHQIVQVYSKYGAIIFILHATKDKVTNFFSKKTIFNVGWNYDFSNGQAPSNIQVRQINNKFQNLNKVDFEKIKVKENINPLT